MIFLFPILALIVVAWLTFWAIRISFWLLMAMLAAMIAVGYAILWALRPQVAQWTARRQSTPEVGGSNPSLRSAASTDLLSPGRASRESDMGDGGSFPTWPYIGDRP